MTRLPWHHRRSCAAELPMVIMVMMMTTMTVMVEGVALKTGERSSRMKRSESSEAEWSIWFNSDRPWDGEGDFETTDNIKKTQRICSWDQDVVAAQCRVSGTNDTFDSSTSAFLDDRLQQACSSHGLICLNSQQTSGRCHDYQVRFLCQAPQTDEGSDSLFPNLDFRIYILLAAVPLLVIVARLMWTCCCKARLKRQRQLRQQQRQQRGSLSSGSLSTSSSQASFDSTLANPPPPYTELFGDGQPTNVFAITSGGECASCGKCLHPPYFVQGVTVSATTTTSPSVQQPQGGEEGERGRSGATVPSPSSPPGSPDDVFLPAAPSSSQASVTTQTPTASSAGPARRPSLQGAAAPPLSPPALLQPQPATPTSSSSPDGTQTRCTCACHRLASGQVNLAFRWDSSDPVGTSGPPPPLHPGMHKPVFSFPRIDSTTSFTSYTSLPDYEEALEILKKSGLFLDEEKV